MSVSVSWNLVFGLKPRITQSPRKFDKHFTRNQDRPGLPQQYAQEIPRQTSAPVVGAHQNIHIQNNSHRIGR